MHHYPRRIGDYLAATAHLSLLEHGVYARLLDAYYIREQPLPSELREAGYPIKTTLVRRGGARVAEYRL